MIINNNVKLSFIQKRLYILNIINIIVYMENYKYNLKKIDRFNEYNSGQ